MAFTASGVIYPFVTKGVKESLLLWAQFGSVFSVLHIDGWLSVGVAYALTTLLFAIFTISSGGRFCLLFRDLDLSSSCHRIGSGSYIQQRQWT